MAETPNQISTATEIAIGSNLFVINGYSAAKDIGVGKYIASDAFTLGGYEWAIYFYPYGKFPEDDSSYVSVYVAPATEIKLYVKFELTLIDQSGKGKHKMQTCFNKPLTCPIEGMGGYKHFFKRDMLEKSDYLRDDCLKIYCTVGVFRPTIDSSRLCSIQVPDSDRENVDKQPIPSCLMKETKCGSNLFVIQGYSAAKGIGPGNRIVSNEFWVGGYKWAIYFYPNGQNPDNSAYVSVFIAMLSEGMDVSALFELTLMDQSGKGNHRVTSRFDKLLPIKIERRGSMWGFKSYLNRAMLETSDFLRDDCLKIYCTVGVVVSSIDSSRLGSIQVPDSEIGLHIGTLLENTEGCDIAFNVSGEKFYAHKLILVARSPKLWSELVEGVDSEEVMVPDMEPIAFKTLLHFIYTDALAENEVITSAPLVADTLTAKLLAAAVRYELKRLKRLCESHLCKYITPNSVGQVHALADRYNAAELKDVCLKFAGDTLTALMHGDDGSEYLEETLPSLKSELSNSMGGSDDDYGNGSGITSRVSGQLDDGGDRSGRRVKQRLEKEKEKEKEKDATSS